MNWLRRKVAVISTCLRMGRGWSGRRGLFEVMRKLTKSSPQWDAEHIITVPCRVGNRDADLSLRDISSDTIIFKEMFVEGDYTSLSMLSFVPTVIFDVGANAGFAAVLMKSRFPNSRIIGFEPGPSENAVASRNYQAIGEAAPFKIALGNTNGTARFYADAEHSGGQHLLSKDDNAGIEVSIARLEDFMRAHALPLPELIKMDIEGAEHDALLGLGARLREVRAVLMETHSLALHLSCTALLKDAGMSIRSETPRPGDCRVLLAERD